MRLGVLLVLTLLLRGRDLGAGPLSTPWDPAYVGPDLDIHDEATRFLPAALAARAGAGARTTGMPPGADHPLGGWNESAIAVNPTHASNIAYASLFELRVSNDGGTTWQPPVPARVPGSHLIEGDPSLAFDDSGRLFWCYLGAPLGAFGPLGGIDIFVVECDPASGALLGDPIDVTQQIGLPGSGGNLHDKAWLAVDAHPASPYAGRLHLVWTSFPAGGGTIGLTSHSADHGHTWSPAVPLGAAGSSFDWPCHLTVAPDGNVYVAEHRQPGFFAGAPDGVSGYVNVYRSMDGGATFPRQGVALPAGQADMTFNRQSFPGSIPGTDFLLQGSVQPWVLADPHVEGRVYVVANDDPDDDVTSGDAANVYLARSDDFGLTWSPRVRVDQGPGTSFQVMPTAAIDPVSGAIVVYYYDNRMGALNPGGNDLLDVYAAVSVDGGLSFLPDFRIDDQPFDPDAGARCRYDCGPPIEDVWSEAGGRAFAVALTGQLLTSNGGVWTIVNSSSTNPKTGVWGTSPTNVYTCGAGGEITRYNGFLVQIQLHATLQDLFAIDGRSASDIWAVGANGTVIHSNGVTWSVIPSGTTEHLHDVWANPAGSIFVAGSRGTVRRYDGAWTDLSIPTDEVLYGVWGASDTDLWAVGGGGGLFHRSGGVWTRIESGLGFLSAVWGSSATDVFTLGWGRVGHFDGATWSGQDPGEHLLYRAHGSGPNNVFAVGENGFITHYDGTSWTPQDNPLLPSMPTRRIGEYNGIAAGGSRSFAVWCGNSAPGAAAPLNQQALFDGFDTAWQTGISLYDPTRHADEVVLERPSPNPATRGFSVAYVLPRSLGVDLSLVDVQGRRVATLLHGVQPAGRHVVSWTPRGAGGDPAAGVYFLRLSAGREDRARRLAITR